MYNTALCKMENHHVKGIRCRIVKVVVFKPLGPFTAVGSNPDREIGFFPVRKLPI
jgi:hypothetical protein